MKIVTVSGKAGHGKDFCADVFIKNALTRNLVFIKFPLASLVKARVYAMNPEYSFEEIFYSKPPRVRELLQQEGTEKGRDVYGHDIWTRQVYALARYLLSSNVEGIVVPDVRFFNELSFFRDLGATTFWVDSNRPTLVGEAAKHRSETEFDGVNKHVTFDVVINNDIGRTVDEITEYFVECFA